MIISLYSINSFALITETECVLCEVGTGLIDLVVTYRSCQLRRSVAGLSPRKTLLSPRSVHVRSVVDTVALWQVSLPGFHFTPVSIISPILYILFSPVSTIPPILYILFPPVSTIPPILYILFPPVSIIPPILQTHHHLHDKHTRRKKGEAWEPSKTNALSAIEEHWIKKYSDITVTVRWNISF